MLNTALVVVTGGSGGRQIVLDTSRQRQIEHGLSQRHARIFGRRIRSRWRWCVVSSTVSDDPAAGEDEVELRERIALKASRRAAPDTEARAAWARNGRLFQFEPFVRVCADPGIFSMPSLDR